MNAAGQDQAATNRPKSVAFLLVEQFSMIAFCSAIEPLRLANRAAGRPLYQYAVYSEDGQTCRASNGVVMNVNGRFVDAVEHDVMLVCGGVDIHLPDHRQATGALRRGVARGAMIGAVCTGTHVLAEAGLLDGHRATIHWENLEGLLLQHSELDVGSELFEIDRNRATCAGGTASADMMLSLIAKDHGDQIASEVADQLIHHRIRESGERQRMDLRVSLGVSHPKLLKAVTLMQEHVDDPLSSHDLADKVGLSTRQLERLFYKFLSRSPAKHYLKIRLDRARFLIRQTAAPLLSIAMECGFTSASHFSKAYVDHFGYTPSAERKSTQRFAKSA